VKREAVGDILVQGENGAQALVAEHLVEFFEQNLTKVCCHDLCGHERRVEAQMDWICCSLLFRHCSLGVQLSECVISLHATID
jgi:hypothetical protein